MGSSSNAPRPGFEDAPAERPGAIALYTVDEVAQQLRVSRSKIYGLIARGKLNVHRLPAIRVSQQDIQEFLEGSRSQYRPAVFRSATIRLKHLR